MARADLLTVEVLIYDRLTFDARQVTLAPFAQLSVYVIRVTIDRDSVDRVDMFANVVVYEAQLRGTVAQ